MELPSLDIVAVLFKLLPGFLAAAVFHGLTPYPKRDMFDRIVAALIFTLVAELGLSIVRACLLWFGSHAFSLGQWNEHVQLGLAAAIGLLLGVGWAYAVNKGHTHSLLRKWGITKKSSLPTQWFSAFSEMERFVILHFTNGRRLMGWPKEWPDEPGSGHFILLDPSWILDDGSEASLPQIEALLISANGVEAVEFLRFDDDPALVEQDETIEEAKQLLAGARKVHADE